MIDERVADERSTFDQNSSYILIPFWFYTYAEVNPVIKYSYFQAGLKDTIPRLVKQNLKESGIFKEYQFAQTGNTACSPSKDAYQLILRLKKAAWKRSLTSYGLSYAGMYLWLFLPKSYGSVVLSIEATLREPETHRIIKNDVFTQEVSTTEWIYDQMNYQPPISEFALEEAFPGIMKSMREMLVDALKEQQKNK